VKAAMQLWIDTATGISVDPVPEPRGHRLVFAMTPFPHRRVDFPVAARRCRNLIEKIAAGQFARGNRLGRCQQPGRSEGCNSLAMPGISRAPVIERKSFATPDDFQTCEIFEPMPKGAEPIWS